VAALGMRNEFAGIRKRGDLVASDDPTDDEIAQAMANYEISNCNLDHYPKCYCNRCQIYCPAGSWKETFGDTGLSRH
jgi:Pyruvate/2-oxoacid:ferredoxin oxidoreductase delta subunit